MTLFSVSGQSRKETASFQSGLYERHYRRLYNTCLRIVGNRQEAEEAMHDTFLKIFNHLGKWDGDERAFHAWSNRIAINTAIDRIKGRKIQFEAIEDVEIPEEETDEEQISLSVEAIWEALSRLPEGYRIILSLRLFEELDFEEIAQILNIRASTVRSQFARGRRNLIRELNRYQEN